MEPFHIFGLWAAARENTEHKRLLFIPSKVLVSLLEKIQGDSSQRSKDEDNPFVRGSHVMHHTSIGRIKPELLQFFAMLVKEKVGYIRSHVALGLISHGDELFCDGIDFGMSSERRRRVLPVKVVSA